MKRKDYLVDKLSNEEKLYLNDIQESINEYNKKIDEIFKEKETELMRV